jgi:hypothetical protein
MAVAALYQAFVHPVMERHIEGRLHVRVTLEAKSRLLGLQQSGLWHRLMDVVAANATYIRLGMRRTQEIGMSGRVAPQAPGVYILGRSLGGIENFGLVAAALNVRPARPVAILAGNSRPTRFGTPRTAVFQGHAVVGVGTEVFGHLFVA